MNAPCYPFCEFANHSLFGHKRFVSAFFLLYKRTSFACMHMCVCVYVYIGEYTHKYVYNICEFKCLSW